MPGSALELKTLAILEAKATEDGHGTLEGYASVKGNIDAYGDVIVDGAYSNLSQITFKSGWSGMDHQGVVGYFIDVKEDAKGLYVKVAFHSTQEAQDARKIVTERLAAGKDVGMSIMYRTLEAEPGTKDGQDVRYLKSIEVVEAGFVMLPANTAATVTSAKSSAGSRFDDHADRALGDVRDLVTRLETFKADRSQGLSEKHLALVGELVSSLAALQPAPEEPADPEEIKSLAPSWN